MKGYEKKNDLRSNIFDQCFIFIIYERL